MCCLLPPSPGLDPELPPSPLIWFEAVWLPQWKYHNRLQRLKALCARMCVRRYVMCVVCARNINPSCTVCKHIYAHTHSCTHTCTRLTLSSFPGVLLIDSARSCKGLWWKLGGWRSRGGVKGFEAGARESEKEG